MTDTYLGASSRASKPIGNLQRCEIPGGSAKTSALKPAVCHRFSEQFRR